MPLQNTEPLVIPATEEKTYPHLWLYNTIIHAPSVNNGSIVIETLPYNGDSQEIGSGANMVPIHTNKLWEAIEEVPEVKTAMNAIFAAIEPLRAWIAGENQPTATEPVITETPIEAPLSSMETLVEEVPVEETVQPPTE